MKVRVSYTTDVSDEYRRVINHYYGRNGLATREQVREWLIRYGSSEDDNLMWDLLTKLCRHEPAMTITKQSGITVASVLCNRAETPRRKEARNECQRSLQAVRQGQGVPAAGEGDATPPEGDAAEAEAAELMDELGRQDIEIDDLIDRAVEEDAAND